MAREFSRTRRIGEQMQRELAELIQREVKDPRLGMVTVSGVEVSRDLSHAKVFITSYGEAEQAAQDILILRKMAGFLRHALGKRMVMRKLPELHFIYDQSVEQGSRIDALIAQAVAKDKQRSEDK